MKEWKKVFGIIYSYPFFGLGWLAGFVAKVLRLAWAALAEGYTTGKQL